MISEIIHIKDNEIANDKAFDKFLNELKEKDGRYLIEAKRKNRRSIPQNKYYWGVCIAMVKDRLIELGNDVDSELVHTYLKERFNSKELFGKYGVLIGSAGDTTTDLTTVQFDEYMEKIKQFAAEALDIFIPNPNSQSALFNEQMQIQ